MVPALGVTLLCTIGLALWARWLGRLYGVPRFVRYLVWLIVVAWAVGAGGSMWGLINAFGAVSGESVDPSQKARILAEGISEAMNAFAFSTGILLLAAIVMLGLTWRYCWAAKPPEVPRDPPYR
jgi:hypothetical protein